MCKAQAPELSLQGCDVSSFDHSVLSLAAPETSSANLLSQVRRPLSFLSSCNCAVPKLSYDWLRFCSIWGHQGTFFLLKQSSTAVDCCQQILQVWFSVWLSSISWLLSLFLEPLAGFRDTTGCNPALALEQVPAVTLLQSFILTNVLFQH